MLDQYIKLPEVRHDSEYWEQHRMVSCNPNSEELLKGIGVLVTRVEKDPSLPDTSWMAGLGRLVFPPGFRIGEFVPYPLLEVADVSDGEGRKQFALQRQNSLVTVSTTALYFAADRKTAAAYLDSLPREIDGRRVISVYDVQKERTASDSDFEFDGIFALPSLVRLSHHQERVWKRDTAREGLELQIVLVGEGEFFKSDDAIVPPPSNYHAYLSISDEQWARIDLGKIDFEKMKGHINDHVLPRILKLLTPALPNRSGIQKEFSLLFATAQAGTEMSTVPVNPA